MAVTQQQFMDIYQSLSPEKQANAYNVVDDQQRQWIDEYKASQNNINPDTWKNLGTWNYWDTSADRQQEIVNNLNEAYKQDPSKFSDWNTFSQNFNYDYSWRSDKERETMKNWYEYTTWQKWIDYNDVSNTDYFLSQLIGWQTVWGTWAAVTSAYNRYKNYQSLSGMTPEQIASAISSDSINAVGQSMIDLKNYSPALYAQVQSILQNQTEVDDINAVWTGIYDWLTKTETNSNYTKYNFTDEYAKNASVIKQYNESLYKKIEWLGGDTAAYVSIVASMLQNPLIQANKDEIENIEWEINKIQDNIWTIWDTARERLWSEAPEDLVSAYISQQTKNLQTQLRTLNNSLLVAQWKLDNQLSEVDALIDAINQWLKTYWEDWTSSSKNNYQYVSWSKYQEAWYFNKATWEFYKLWETPDTHDYESSDPTRLQEIADNLVDIANSKDVYVFRDRSAFNDYFKYNKRSAAQKAVLDEFWNANAQKLKPYADAAYKEYQASQSTWSWWWGSWWGTSDDKPSLVKDIKSALIAWPVNFSSSTMKKTYWKYKQAQSWDEDTTNDYLQEIWKISTVEELASMLSHLTKDANKQALLNPLKTKVIKEMQDVTWWNKSKKQKEILQWYADKLWINAVTLVKWWWIAKEEEN